MIRGIDSITVFSENAKKLSEFYREKVGLKLTLEAEMGENNEGLYGFQMKQGSEFYITDHSKIKGKNRQPERFIINFEVDDIEKETARMKKAEVRLIQDIYHVEGYGQIATFEDIDGNFFQFVQVRAK